MKTRLICLFLSLVMLVGMLPAAYATEETETTQSTETTAAAVEPTGETTAPTEVTTAPTEETTAPTEETTAPTEETTAPTEETTAPTEETTAPTEETTAPTEETTAPTEETTAPTEETTAPTEETTVPTEETTIPTEETQVVEPTSTEVKAGTRISKTERNSYVKTGVSTPIATMALDERDLPQLGAAYNLKWNVGRYWVMNESGKYEYYEYEETGTLSFDLMAPQDYNCYAYVELYKVGQAEPVWGVSYWVDPEFNTLSVSLMDEIDPESGSYYATVQVFTDTPYYAPSDVVTSEVWTYNRPAQKLEACRNITLNFPYLSWEGFADSDYNMYLIRVIEVLDDFEYTWGWAYTNSTSIDVGDYWYISNLSGNYRFEIRAISSDIAVVGNSDWATSELIAFEDGSPIGQWQPMYRLYNPYTLEHLFTTNAWERDNLPNAGWLYEGVAWEAPTTGTPIYRLYNPYSDGHFYTASEAEIDTLLPLGWQMDGVVTYGADSSGTPIYRLFNPYETKNYHHYTTSWDEINMLTGLGWILEGVAWYAA